jgi:hypothetical protein
MFDNPLKSLPGEGIEPSPGVTPRGDFKSPASTVSPPRLRSKIKSLAQERTLVRYSSGTVFSSGSL